MYANQNMSTDRIDIDRIRYSVYNIWVLRQLNSSLQLVDVLVILARDKKRLNFDISVSMAIIEL